MQRLSLQAVGARCCLSKVMSQPYCPGDVQVMGEDTAAFTTVMSLVDGGHPSALMFPAHVTEVSSAL